MTLQDIFNHLTFGELSMIKLGGLEPPDQGIQDTSGSTHEPGMTEESRREVLGHIELGLMALYKRFFISKRLLLVNLIENKKFYRIHADFAVSNTASTESLRYIIDTDEPLIDEILKINEIFLLVSDTGSNTGSASSTGLTNFSHGIGQLPSFNLPSYINKKQPAKLNVIGDPHSIITPSLTTISLPDTFFNGTRSEPEYLEISCHMGHRKLDKNLAIYAPDTVLIDLPSTYLQALLYYIASRVMTPKGMQADFHQGNSYYAKYEGECARLIAENMDIDEHSDNVHFERGGYV